MNAEEALAAVLAKIPGEEPSLSDRSNGPAKKCVCGGSDHRRRSNSLCPLNKKNKDQDRQ